jgi:large subunit ribosomal protein L9
MDVLLLQDVSRVGKRNDLLQVGDGFALNFLLPRGFALVATPTVRKQFAEHIRLRAEERERERQLRLGVASSLAGKSIRFVKKATKTGKLYAAISTKLLVEAVKQQLALDLDESAFEIPEPIKAAGTFTISVRIADQSISLPVIIEAEKTKA